MSLSAKVGVVAAFWLAVALVQTFNWGEGIPKAIVLLLILLGMAGATVVALGGQATPLPVSLQRAIPIALGLCLAAEIAYLGARILHPHLIDIATTTLAAGDALLKGGNPYALPIDAGPETAGFTGYKYLPVMIATFLPLGAPFSERGILATNLVLFFACVWMMRQLAHSTLAPLLLAMLPLVPEQIFAKGATDLAAVLPLLGALAACERSSFAAGICVGLSIAAKPLPGAMFLPCLIPHDGKWRYGAGILVGLAPVLPFLWLSPRDLFSNVVLFNLSRAADATSWLHAAPTPAKYAAVLVLAAAFLASAAYVSGRAVPLVTRCGIGTMLTIAAILAGPGAHHNYQLWWLPFSCLVLARLLAPSRDAACQDFALRYTEAAEVDASRGP